MALTSSHGQTRPSQSAQRAARAAADSPHALINLARLVKSLEDKSADDREARDDPEQSGWAALEVGRDLQSIAYARALLGYLQEGDQQSSSAGAQLSALSAVLDQVEKRYGGKATNRKPSLSPRSSFKRQDSLKLSSLDASGTKPINALHPISSSEQVVEAPHGLQEEPVAAVKDGSQQLRRRQAAAPSLEEYLMARQCEDRADGETGLLPIKKKSPTAAVAKGPSKDARDQLFGGARPGQGSAQMHEELGGQLADMSHQLKLNAMHFSNALEEEKALLDTSSAQLETNLSSTQTSKRHLGNVSSKSRGTTCLTLGVVILVLVIFVWTYMLIRFT